MDDRQFGNMDNESREKLSEEIEISKKKQKEKDLLRKKAVAYREEIDTLIISSEYEELLEFYEKEDLKRLSGIENDIAIFQIILYIYQMEQRENVEQGILNGVRSMGEAVERYLQMKFLLWRVEFRDEEEGRAAFQNMQQISIPFLKYLIHTSSFDKANTAYKLAMFFKGAGKIASAFAMLNYTNELSPDAEIVFCEMADICMMAGKYKDAAACIARIKEPSEVLVKYQQKWGL